jgi:hypothetical protein
MQKESLLINLIGRRHVQNLAPPPYLVRTFNRLGTPDREIQQRQVTIGLKIATTLPLPPRATISGPAPISAGGKPPLTLFSPDKCGTHPLYQFPVRTLYQ